MAHSTAVPLAPTDAVRLRQIAGRVLGLEPDHFEWARPLTAYGLDSMNALQLVADLEDAFGRRLPEWLLLEHPTLAALHDFMAGHEDRGDAHATLIASDGRLPDDLRPDCPAPAIKIAPRHVLLTGATGFLGASLLRELLRNRDTRVTCLVRGDAASAHRRLRAHLRRYRAWRPSFSDRLRVVAGDLTAPRLGVSESSYAELASSTDAICHAAADVSWVQPYGALRAANVSATIELLRLACAGAPKAFTFVSSLSVCLATDGPPVVDEQTDMLPHVERLPLGYAQTKCVAEALVRQAALRGLSARIYRPALLAGHARTGISNLNDFLAVLIKGCIQMGAAPDLDWAFDAIPVDYAARAIVELDKRLPSGSVVHLAHPQPRHWRECVLWANYYGYHVRLQPFDQWREQLERDAADPDHALHTLRSFFSRRVQRSRSVAELYQTDERPAVLHRRSQEVLHETALPCPALNAALLHKYFDSYVKRGFLPAVSRHKTPARTSTAMREDVAGALRAHYRDRGLRISRARALDQSSNRSILAELSRWRWGSGVGLSHYCLHLDGRRGSSTVAVVVKRKVRDDDLLDVGETLADTCDPLVAHELRRARDLVGIRMSHLREAAIYEMRDERFRQHLPRCLGTWRSDHQASYGLVLERLEGMALIDACDDVALWTAPCILAAVDGLASLHAVWLGREGELSEEPWIGHVTSLQTVERLMPLWQALAAHAAPQLTRYAGAELAWTHRRLAARALGWWPALLELPRTLIHNDFNSRNIAIRRTRAGLRLVAYDWELAALGAPQRDLAELLCFVLPEDVSAQEIEHWVEHHRRRLEEESGIRLPAHSWRGGFASALAEFLVGRLGFYALIDRVSPQSFLPRVLRTWARAYAVASVWAVKDAA